MDTQESSSNQYASDLVFYINDEAHRIDDADPNLLLVDYLRSPEVSLTGTKHACGQGGCGSCTVMLSQYRHAAQEVRHIAVNACLLPICSLDGMQITTIEGIGSVNAELSPVQYRIAKENGSQCGYCTPGFVMNLHSFLVANPRPTRKQIEKNFDGNICRCTGYRPILYAAKKFAEERNHDEAKNTPDCYVDPGLRIHRSDDITASFPSQLKIPPRAVAFGRNGCQWFRPLDLAALAKLQTQFETQSVKYVVGNTSVGIPDIRPEAPEVYIDISQIDTLLGIEFSSDGLKIGAATTYAELLHALETQAAERTGAQKRTIDALHYMTERTAGAIVRNRASIAGNTMLVALNASPGGTPFPSDLFTALCVLRTKLEFEFEGARKQRDVFGFADWLSRKPENASKVIIVRYHIPWIDETARTQLYKTAMRHVNSHSLVNAGLSCKIDTPVNAADPVIEASRLFFGALAPLPFRAMNTEKFMNGRLCNNETLREAQDVLRTELNDARAQLPEWFRDLPEDGIDPAYRTDLALAFLRKFFLELLLEFCPDAVPPEDRSAPARPERPVTRGKQNYAKPAEGNPLGQPYLKLSAFEQASGQARYTHDIELPRSAVFGSFVISRCARGTFHYRNTTGNAEILKEELVARLRQRFDNFVAYITAADVPSGGTTHSADKTDPWFSDGSVTYYGQSLGLIVAKTEQAALKIARYVRDEHVAYSDIENPVLTIAEARKKGQFFEGYTKDRDDNQTIESPDYAKHNSWVGKQGDFEVDGIPCTVVSRTQHTGFQNHFYMETQSCVAIPGDGDNITVYASTQMPRAVQTDVAKTLNVLMNRVEVRVQRLGGGYGGKCGRSCYVAIPAALAAFVLRRPVKVLMDRNADSEMIGNRHAYTGEYSIAVANTGADLGRMLGCSTHFFSNGGNTRDCSFDVMDCAQLGADGAYSMPFFYSTGSICKTNISSSTSMRSYGSMQAQIIQEDAVEAASHALGMAPEKVRARNFYNPGDKTPYGQALDYCLMKPVWERTLRLSNFEERKKKVEKFNRQNRWRKRGICIMPVKYGLGYNLGWLMQGGALININALDGSVLVEHGGVEMGQGIVTKMAQLAASTLNIPLELVVTTATDTLTVPNPIATGATSSSDIAGGAVRKACRRQRKRLKKFCRKMRKIKGDPYCEKKGINYWDYPSKWNTVVDGKLIWTNITNLALVNRIDLSSQALFATPGLENDKDQQFYGFTYSAACSEVEIDVLTGETEVVRVDIVYDVGESLNPAIDIGQVEGAFVMGMGYVLTEDMVFQSSGEHAGRLNTPNTWTYKPPAISTIPIELNVDLFPRHDAPDIPLNPNLMMSSKGIGEPPLVLASSVFFAIKHAVLSARIDNGMENKWFDMPAPATVQIVQQVCQKNLDANGY